MFSSCAPANVICPPPPSFSSIICTFISPIDLPLIYTLSSIFPSTNDAVIPPIVSSSSAALAAIMLAFSSAWSYIDIAIFPFIISDFDTMFDIV